MSITAPCVIIFDEVPYTGSSELFVYAPDAIFKTMHLGSSSDDQMDSHTGFEIRGVEGITYDGNTVFDGGGWTSASLRGIYVESWGATAEGLDALEAFLQGPNTDSGSLYPADLSGQRIQFHATDLLDYNVSGSLDYISKGQDFFTMKWLTVSGVKKLRYELYSQGITVYPYDNSSQNWSDEEYRIVSIANPDPDDPYAGTGYTKPAFVLWIWFNAEPIPLPTYKLGWRYTPLS